jgi:uncharacterized protein YndB with AHSA1/START domain
MTETRHESFTITRTYAKCRAHVWSAWSDGPKKRRFLVGDDMKAEPSAFAFDFSVGGVERHLFDSPMGQHENRTTYFDIADEERIVFAYSMSLNGRVHSVSVATVTFADAGGGTRVEFTEQITVIGESDGAEGRTHGWKALLESVDKTLSAELRADVSA